MHVLPAFPRSPAINLALLPCAGRCFCIVLLRAVWGLVTFCFMINDKFSTLTAVLRSFLFISEITQVYNMNLTH